MVVVRKGRRKYWPCKNLAATPQDFFILDPEDYAAAEDAGTIYAVFHSHPISPATPSEADRVACEKTGVPWFIVSPYNGKWAEIEPTGYISPLIGRQWVWGVSDCWTLARDWYKQEWDLELRDWSRPVDPAAFVLDPMFERCFEETGFVDVTGDQIKVGDLLLISIASPGLNHCAVYVGDQMILQHTGGRISSRDIYGGYYQKNTGRVLRHSSRC